MVQGLYHLDFKGKNSRLRGSGRIYLLFVECKLEDLKVASEEDGHNVCGCIGERLLKGRV